MTAQRFPGDPEGSQIRSGIHTVAWLTRRPARGNYSIERLIDALRPEVEAQGWQVDVCVAPFRSRGVWRRCMNAVWAWLVQPVSLAVVWGDINYILPFVRADRKILVVHDLLSLERMKGARRTLYRWIWWRWPIAAADEVVAVSEYTAEMLRQEFDERLPITVIDNPLTVRSRKEFRQHTGSGRIDGRVRVLQVGTKWNKNLIRVAKATHRIGGELRVVGHLTRTEHDELISLGLCFTLLEDLTDEEMIQEIRNADVLALVSLAEGFGLPILEAQAIGTPVVVSDREPMRTVAGGGSVLVDPLDVEGIAEGIMSAAGQTGRGEGSVVRGQKNVERYLADQAADRWVAVFERVVEGVHTGAEV